LLAIGLVWRAIRAGKGIAIAGAVLGLTCLAHLMYGWMGAITACLIAVIPDPGSRVMVRIGRAAMVGAVAVVLSLFPLMPLRTDGWLLSHARQELASKFDSYGAQTVLGWLFRGELMDGGTRIPVLTAMS